MMLQWSIGLPMFRYFHKSTPNATQAMKIPSENSRIDTKVQTILRINSCQTNIFHFIFFNDRKDMADAIMNCCKAESYQIVHI